MNKNLKGELTIMGSLGIKPNYAALGRKYGMDPRTVKKYHNGYKGKPATREKGSMLDQYRQEIADKLKIPRVTVQGVYEFMVKKYSIDSMGSRSNFQRYVKDNDLRADNETSGNPRYEKGPGEQAQVDWKEDIGIADRNGEIFTVNVLHLVLKYSRFSHLEISIQKRFEDVSRGLINGFRKFGGVPEELLFDNMSTVANTRSRPKRPTAAIARMAREFGFRVRLCGTRKPETKGTVEAKNKVIDQIRAYEGEFEGIEELAAIIEGINRDMNININQDTGMSPTALFYKEKEHLKPLPAGDIINTYLTPTKYRVSNEALIRYGGSRYSVNPELIGEDVTADMLGNKLYIYYTGKLAAVHTLTDNPINYHEDHYRTLLAGKMKQEDIDSIAADNLARMDSLLESRRVSVSEVEATRSAEALIAYLNQSDYGRWIIGYYAHLTENERRTFIKGMNRILPHVGNREAFMSHIKYSMKESRCRHLDFDCWVNDFMANDKDDCILTDEGYRIIQDRYSEDITEFIEGIMAAHDDDETKEGIK